MRNGAPYFLVCVKLSWIDNGVPAPLAKVSFLLGPQAAGRANTPAFCGGIGVDRIGKTAEADHSISLVIIVIKASLLLKADRAQPAVLASELQLGIQAEIVIRALQGTGVRGGRVGA